MPRLIPKNLVDSLLRTRKQIVDFLLPRLQTSMFRHSRPILPKQLLEHPFGMASKQTVLVVEGGILKYGNQQSTQQLQVRG